MDASPTLYIALAAGVLSAGLYVFDDEDRGDLNIASYLLLAAAPAVYLLSLSWDESFEAIAVVLAAVAAALTATRLLLATGRVSMLLPAGLLAVVAIGGAGAYVAVERPAVPSLRRAGSGGERLAETRALTASNGLDAPLQAAAGRTLRVAAATCSGREARVRFAWQPDAAAGEQWLDLSMVDGSFAAATYVSLGPLAPAAAEYVWTGAIDSQPRFWRVNTRTGSGWRPSESAAVTSC